MSGSATLPIPGSDEAGAQGCRCPVLDNNHGRFPPWQAGPDAPANDPRSYLISEACALHADLFPC